LVNNRNVIENVLATIALAGNKKDVPVLARDVADSLRRDLADRVVFFIRAEGEEHAALWKAEKTRGLGRRRATVPLRSRRARRLPGLHRLAPGCAADGMAPQRDHPVEGDVCR
jgi:hypothetical protein